MTAHETPGSLQRFEETLASECFWRLAEPILDVPGAPVGRPRMYPLLVGLIFAAAKEAFSGARSAAAELRHPLIWSVACSVVRERFPEDQSRWLPERPIRRHHWDYMKKKFFLTDEMVVEWRAGLRDGAVMLARDSGIMSRSVGDSFTHPSEANMFFADGKVLAPTQRAQAGSTRLDKTTGKYVPLRFDPDADFHVEGGSSDRVWGTKFVHVSSRGPHGRLIYDVDHVGPSRGGEGGVVLDILEGLSPLLPGARGITYDMAWRGKHMQRAMTELGLLSVARVASKSKGDGVGGKRTPKFKPLQLVSVLIHGVKRSIMIHVEDGAPGVMVPDVEGTERFLPLERVRIHRNPLASGKFQWYQDYLLPAELGGGKISLRLDKTAEDELRGFNRAEMLRPIPPRDPDFPRLHALRADAESLNRGIENRLYWNRAHSVGARAQLLDLIMHAVAENARFESRLRARERLRAA